MRKIILSMIFISTFMFADDIYIYSIDNKDAKITPSVIEEAFKKAGFHISENRDMNDPFLKQFGDTDFSVYNLFTVINVNMIKTLLSKAPQSGAFAPQSMSIWTNKGDTSLNIAFLSKEAMANILSINTSTQEINDNEKLIKSVVESVMKGGSYKKVSYQKALVYKPLLSLYDTDVEGSYEERVEEIQMLIDDGLKPNGFVQAGFNNLNYHLNAYGVNEFDFYDVYSICKLKVIYQVAKTRPEAGAFAPCSLYMYKKSGDDKIHLGFPNVYNWLSLLNITDETAKFELEDAQSRMNEILEIALEN
ncbi:DUF302 domain-containing protein [Arcobacter sp. FWKO B]|uniref:DUF302 domain-containing protein n=1 Tax=Arcobacter sp. FWKO B TaxID=2593672 RepID=UPI001907B506|nr:DUF302 domain-containing protein [Arcobacter sp. FWKO B]